MGGENSIQIKDFSGTTTGEYSVNLSWSGTTSGDYSHAEGYVTTASGKYSHAEGYGTTASGYCSHAEGLATQSNGEASHAEGFGTKASGVNSHAEGVTNIASTLSIHSVGVNSKNAEDIYYDTKSDKNGYKYLIGIGDYDGTNLSVTDDSGNESLNPDIKSVQEVINETVSNVEILSGLTYEVIQDESVFSSWFD